MRRAVLALGLILVLALCATPLLAGTKPVDTKATAPAHAAVSDPLLTVTTIQVRDQDVREVLGMVFDAMKAGFVLTDDVTGKITMNAPNTSIRQILNMICTSKGLYWWKSDSSYVVSGKPAPTDRNDSTTEPTSATAKPVEAKEASTAPVRYYSVANVHPRDLAACFNIKQRPTPEGMRWMSSLTSYVPNPDGTIAPQPEADNNPVLKPYSSGISRLGESSQFPGSSSSATSTNPFSSGRTGTTGRTGLTGFTSPTGEITPEQQEMLESGIDISAPFAYLLPSGMTAPVAYEPLNLLIFQATDEAYDRFLELMSIFDKKPKEVLIEVQFITMTTGDVFAMGMDWFYNVGRSSFAVSGFNPGTGISIGFAKGSKFAAEMSALVSNNRARVIQSSRIATQNNTPAFISASDSVPVVTFTGATAVPNGGIIASGTEINYIDIPTNLNITPRINGDDSVTAILQPTVSTYRLVSIPIPGGDTQNAPQISQSNLSCIMNIKDGETLVIGGFVNRTESKNRNRVPLLGDLPLLGRLLFTRTEKNLSDIETLVFVTPHVIKDEFTAGTNVTF
jgi:type II secretory pathway component GspD/PulD (secretin)